MTEEEAKTKWCPMVRFYNPKDCRLPENLHAEDYANKLHKQHAFDCCIASDCMMWTQTFIEKLGDDENTYIDTKDGRCGLAK